MQIRRLEARDFGGLQQMISALASFHGDAAANLPKEDHEDLMGPNPWYVIFVAETDEDQLVGYAALLRTGQLQFALRGVDIHHLFVRPAARGQGIGTALVQASIAYAVEQGCRAVVVGTHPDNIKVLSFYETLGFEQRPTEGPRLSIRL